MVGYKGVEPLPVRCERTALPLRQYPKERFVVGLARVELAQLLVPNEAAYHQALSPMSPRSFIDACSRRPALAPDLGVATKGLEPLLDGL
jgi:hypothetical protein